MARGTNPSFRARLRPASSSSTPGPSRRNRSFCRLQQITTQLFASLVCGTLWMKVKAQRYLMKKTQHIVLMSLTRWHDLTAEQCTDGNCTFPQDFTNFHKIHIWQELRDALPWFCYDPKNRDFSMYLGVVLEGHLGGKGGGGGGLSSFTWSSGENKNKIRIKNGDK